MGRGLWLCRRCRRQTSVMAGRVVDRSRLPLTLRLAQGGHVPVNIFLMLRGDVTIHEVRRNNVFEAVILE